MPRFLVLAVLLGSLGATIFLASELFYFAPLRAEAGRITALDEELGGIQQRLARAQAEQAAIGSSAGAETIGALAAQAPDAAAATALLQERVRILAAESGGRLLSSIGSAVELPGLGSRISVQLQSRFDEAGLLRLLRSTEAEQPPIIVEAMTIQPLPVADASPLDVSLSFVGFYVHNNAP